MILKFCGFKTKSEVLKLPTLNVNMVGFVHYPKSKRHLEIEQINALAQFVPDGIDKVVVVVNPTFQLIKHILKQTHINAIQLHGEETIAFIKLIRLNFKNIKIIKALPASQNIIDEIERYRPYVDLFIIDTPSKHYGGTGHSFDWTILKRLKQSVPFLIAGGIDANKIKQIETLHLNHVGYDISSGIEANGMKDKNKMLAVIQQLKGVQENV